MDLAALIIAIVAVVLAAGSLTWQITQHALTGARFNARLTTGSTWEVDYGERYETLFATVVNNGRLAGFVAFAWLAEDTTRPGRELTHGFHTVDGSALPPCALPAQGRCTLGIALTTVQGHFRTGDDRREIRLRAYFSMGTRTVVTSQVLAIPASGVLDPTAAGDGRALPD